MNYWEFVGQQLGYPKCCISEFINNLTNGIYPSNIQKEASRGTGFIPCTSHAIQIINKEIKLEDLIQNRKVDKLFPRFGNRRDLKSMDNNYEHFCKRSKPNS